MGYNTIVMLRNDAWAQIRDNADQVIEGIGHAMHGNGSVGAGNHTNAVEVMKTRHADDQMLYIHTGNSLFELSGYSPDLIAIAQRNKEMREWVERAIMTAEWHIESLKQMLIAVKEDEAKEQKVM